jgi:anti-anti-sigma regulatory factor
MLRITEINVNKTTRRLRLDGKIDSQSYAELEGIWSHRDQANAVNLILDMTGVVYMSDEVACRLSKLRGGSFHIVNCSPFIEMLLGNSVSAKGA